MNRGKYMLGELIVIACGAAFLGLPTLIYLRKKKEILKTLEKYYVVDIGFYNLFITDHNKDSGFLILVW